MVVKFGKPEGYINVNELKSKPDLGMLNYLTNLEMRYKTLKKPGMTVTQKSLKEI